MDFLLRRLDDPNRIAAAIRKPTLAKQSDDTSPVYGFTFAGDLPELIAADLLDQGRESSVLPAMQIVCKQLYEQVVCNEKRSVITVADYTRFGGAMGALDSFLIRTINDAATAARLPPLGESGLDAWILALSDVVGRTEGGTLQTLIASERDLLAKAAEQGFPEADGRAMLGEFAHPDRRLLRVVGEEAGTLAYSLGHDCLGPALLKRSAVAGVRAERRKAERRSRRRKAKAAVWVIAICAIVGIARVTYSVSSLQEKAVSLTSYAERDLSNDFRQRLLLLATVLRKSEPWPARWFINSERPKRVLRSALLKTPIYGGKFTAVGTDPSDQRIITLQHNRFVVHELATQIESFPAPLPSENAEPGIPFSLSVGLLPLPGNAEAVVVYQGSGGSGSLLAARLGDKLRDSGFHIPEEFWNFATFPPRAEIIGGHLRFVGWRRAPDGFIGQEEVLPVQTSISPNFAPDPQAPYVLDLQAAQRQFRRTPVLAEDCNYYSFLAASQEGSREILTLWLGEFGSPAHRTQLSIPVPREEIAKSAVTFARGCSAVLVREPSGKLAVIASHNGQGFADTVPATIDVPPSSGDSVLPASTQAQPAFAAAPVDRSGKWRVAWLVPNGLAVVDVAIDQASSTPVAGGLPFLTGLEADSGFGQLRLSSEGRFAVLMQQRNFSAPVELRAFDLNVDRRRQDLEKKQSVSDLVAEPAGSPSSRTMTIDLAPRNSPLGLVAKRCPSRARNLRDGGSFRKDFRLPAESREWPSTAAKRHCHSAAMLPPARISRSADIKRSGLSYFHH